MLQSRGRQNRRFIVNCIGDVPYSEAVRCYKSFNNLLDFYHCNFGEFSATSPNYTQCERELSTTILCTSRASISLFKHFCAGLSKGGIVFLRASLSV